MTDTYDTTDGLLAEFRGYSHGMPPSYHVTMSWHDFRRMLDRLEAAHRRERELTKPAENVNSGASSDTAGNCAKLREALVKCQGIALQWQADERLGVAGSIEKPEARSASDALIDIEFVANAALAAPPRNCDVGTADEQDRRFVDFCTERHSGSCAGCPDAVGGFTVANGIRECALVWAQMPYAKKGRAS